MDPSKFSYVRNVAAPRLPQILSVTLAKKSYRFRLETFYLDHLMHKARRNQIRRCHVHDVFHLALYNENNPETDLLINDRIVPVKPGAIVMVSPGVPHCFMPSAQDAAYAEITFSMVDSQGRSLSACSFRDLFSLWSGTEYKDPGQILMLPDPVRLLLRHQFENIAQKLHHNHSNLFPATAAISALMFTLIESMSGPKTNIDPRLLRAKEYIEKNYLAALSLKAISAEAGMSHEYFCKQFKHQFGQAPLQYRQQLRVTAAEQLLLFSELPISEIADRLGFNDIYSFSRAFKNSCGISPSKIRINRNLSDTAP